MSRNYRNLRVFELADALVIEVYRVTKSFPAEEKFGLQSQIRRAAVSVPTNIVEGCYRRGDIEFAHFLDISIASAAELQYLLSLAKRLEIASDTDLDERCNVLILSLQGLIQAVRRSD